ncbi:MAG: DUF6090 family protein [Flavobacteriaceae bacterium]|nr:hypothetical protein [Flavobacteriaceae bacterium]
MIKFFRKIRYNLMETGKTGKYLKYAIGEIILVMIGILLALQVSNWNEKRKDRIKEQSVLSSINKEFKMNKIQFDSVLYFHKKAYNGCNKLIAMFPIDIERDNLDTISKHLWDAAYNWTFNPSQGTINSIINTSSFDIISNDELRGLLVSWSDIVLDLQEDEIQNKKVVFEQMDPFFAGNIDYNFNLKDKRNNLNVLESIKFEYLIRLRQALLWELFKPGAEIEVLEKNLERIIELTSEK